MNKDCKICGGNGYIETVAERVPCPDCKPTTTFNLINFKDQIAVEDDGTIWEFDQCIDFDGEEITADCTSDEIAVITVKHPNKEIWCVLVLADFEDIKSVN